jgi:anti-anti-sigma factor
MSVALTHGENSSLVHLEGAIDISDAADLKVALLEALERGKAIEVALSSVAGLDVTAVQLLWAAQREAQRAAVALNFAGQVPEAVSAALADAGLKEHLAFSQNG